MKNYTLIQRNTDFMNAVRSQWRAMAEAGESTAIEKVIEAVINSQAPEFYVTYETAYRFVSLARRGCLPQSMDGRRYRMWHDLNDRTNKIMENNPQWSYGRALVEAIDMGNAPSWYLEPGYARQLYYSILHEGTVKRRTLLRNRDFHDSRFTIHNSQCMMYDA